MQTIRINQPEKLRWLFFAVGLITLGLIVFWSMNARPAFPNIIVLVADDLGVDWAPCYADFNMMPNVSSLCEEGVVFDTVWSNPSCTPTRASILTGRYAIRHRAGASKDTAGDETRRLRLEEIIIPEVLGQIPGIDYQNAAIGKWHLHDKYNGQHESPVTSTFQNYFGSLHGYNYFWRKRNVNGKIDGWDDRYQTTAIVDDTLAWLESQDEGKPWFLWVGFYNPHAPYHLPPNDLHNFDFLEYQHWGRGQANDTHILPEPRFSRVPEVRPYFAAMMQALDTEIGRLLAYLRTEIKRDTYIIFLGDNGTQGEVVFSEAKGYRYKGTVYEGGVRVPLIIVGPRVNEPGRRVSGLVNVSDLFATIIELANGSDTLQSLGLVTDSVNLVPYLSDPESDDLRQWIYTERGSENRQFAHAVRNNKHKLIVRKEGLELYDLVADPFEGTNLLDKSPTEEQLNAARRLFATFIEIYESEDYPFTDIKKDRLEAHVQRLSRL